MNIKEIRAELEEDQAWRQKEIRFLQNQAAGISAKKEQDMFRRAIVLLLYAHFEGFCKFAFKLYIDAINTLNIRCGQANYAIAAASLADLFNVLRNPDKKCAEFRHALPDDTKLHRFARDREFMERTDEFAKRPVKIPDTVVSMEDNLTPLVLRKILYRLGLPHNQFESVKHEIQQLLEYRNGIAHGSMQNGVELEKYESLRTAAYAIMNRVAVDIMESLQGKQFLRAGKL